MVVPRRYRPVSVSRIFLFTQTGERMKHHAGKGPHLRQLIAKHKLEVEQADQWWVVLADNARDARNYIARSTEGRIMAKGGKHRGRPEIQPPPLPPPSGGGGGTGAITPGGFPRPWLYYPTNGFGMPILTGQTLPGTEASWDETVLAKMARWDFVTINTQPFVTTGLPSNWAVISKLKTRNPYIKILWYDSITLRTLNIAPGSPWTAIWDMISANPDKRMYFQSDGTGFPGHVPTPIFWNAGYGDGGAQFAAIWRAFLEDKGADGSFLDTIVPGGVGQAGAEFSNYAIQGYSSTAELVASSKVGSVVMVDAIKEMGQPIWINRGMTDLYYPTTSADTLAGELFEGWDPDQGLIGGGHAPSGPFTFDSAMALVMTYQGSDPTGEGRILIKGEPTSGTPTDNLLGKLGRYVLGSASMAGGRGVVTYRDSGGVTDHNFWIDEYAVDANGLSDLNGATANKGWLGMPTEFGYKAVNAPGDGGLWVRHFDRGVVVANVSGSSLSIDLGRPYRRITGSLQLSVNDGSLVQNLTVPSKDARFLLNA